MIITKDILYVGVNDHDIDLFEGQFDVPLGMAYNSYVINDEKIAVIDSVETRFSGEWLNNIETVTGGRVPDYFIVQHMEPDHSSSITDFMDKYPETVIAASNQAFVMMKNFYGSDYAERRMVLTEGAKLSLGRHELTFITAPMVHWPEVIMTYDAADKVLFSADGFGKFGANDVEDPEGWACEARRYYFGIVGKFGMQVQNVLKKAAGLEIEHICSLHGPVLPLPGEDISYYINTYDTWSAYRAESEGVFIAYTTVYGHTRQAAELLAEKLKAAGCPRVAIADLAREDFYESVEDAFRHDRLVLATTTYNGEIFPKMDDFIRALLERGYQNRRIGIIENGSWAPAAARIIKKLFENSKDITWAENTVTIKSALSEASEAQIDALVGEFA
ncbi:MAG: FprA family A-type flavoprotein [Lachnospiraceae bacterium]|nr:FprA family A-type flavoprotein [Lachnospiraceae bacterium]